MFMNPVFRHFNLFAVLFIVLVSVGPASANDVPSIVRIGIISDGPNSREDNYVGLFREEMTEIAAGAFAVEFPADATVDGGWNAATISRAMDHLLARDDLDVILAVGVGVAADICARQEVAIPVVVPFSFEGCSTTCPKDPSFRVRSIDLGLLVARDLRVFDEVKPYQRVAVLMESTWPASCSGATGALELAPEGVEVEVVPVRSSDSNPMHDLPADVDAVYLMPLQQLDDDAFDRLIADLEEKNLPTFSMLGEQEVDRGVLAGFNSRSTMTSFARGAALDVLDLLEGRPDSTPLSREIPGQLTLNMATAQKLGFSPSWELLSRARLLHDEGFRRDRPINLETAIGRAIQANLDLAVQDRRVAAGAEDIREAKSSYRPHLDVSLGGAQIDENHAIGALGQYARYAAGSLTLTQLIYSDGASANIEIQKDVQQARELDRQSLRLDIARQAVAAYMNVMRTDALVRIRREQVDLTRTNLELARLRRSLGVSAAAEVYRWEAELATARAGLLDAFSVNRLSERQLSRLLDEPLTTRWDVQQPEIETAVKVLGGGDDVALLTTPDGYDRLSVDLVAETTAQAPELAALDAVIAAQERGFKAAKRASYAPTVGLQADVSHILAKDATGGLDLGDIGELIPEFDDTAWMVGVQANLPVVTGGATKARRIKAQEELFALQTDRRNTEEKLSQRTLSALDTAMASWSTISLRRQAADASVRTLELVGDAYGRGAASILDLLDAQNNALTAELTAMTSVYNFLDDWAEVRRSVAGLPGA